MEKVELSTSHIGLRIAATVFFLIVGASALAYGISGLINGDSGWREIQAYTSEGTTCSSDFMLLYNVGSKGSVSKEKRAVTALYTEAARDGYELFNAETELENVHNLKYLSLHPNEEIEVDSQLYAALEKYVKSGDRLLYLGPIYSTYDGIFASSPEMSGDFDPARNEGLRQFGERVCEFARDPQKIDLELLGENRVKLKASADYLDYLKENEIDELINFYWLKNAFIADMIATRFEEEGLNACIISSFDGYTRCLGDSGECAETLLRLDGKAAVPAATMRYSGKMSTVALRSYPASDAENERYLDLGEEFRSRFIDPADGLNRTSISELYGNSRALGCADVALALAPVFVAESFRPPEFGDEIGAVWFEDGEVVAVGDVGEISWVELE